MSESTNWRVKAGEEAYAAATQASLAQPEPLATITVLVYGTGTGQAEVRVGFRDAQVSTATKGSIWKAAQAGIVDASRLL